MSDKEIIQGYLAGNATEYDTIVEWIQEVIRARIWVEKAWIDDVVGDTIEKLLIIFRNNGFQHSSSLKTYVQRVARYTIIDYLRRSKIRQKYDEELQSLLSTQEDFSCFSEE